MEFDIKLPCKGCSGLAELQLIMCMPSSALALPTHFK